MRSKKKIIICVSIVLILLLLTSAFAIFVSLFFRKNDTREQHEQHEHNFSYAKIIRQQSCTEDGIISYCCDCGDEQLEVTLATDHNWDSWQTDKNATCTEAGEKYRSCSLCQASQTEAPPPLEHNYLISVSEENTHVNTYTCTLCNDSFDLDAQHELDLHNSRYISDCDKNYSFKIYCEKDEAYIRQHLYITDSYYHNTSQQDNLSYILNKEYDGYWTVSPSTPYTSGSIYIASRSGEVFFGDMTVRDMTFQIYREESKEFTLSKNVKFLQSLENNKNGYYPYTLEYSKDSGSYWLSLQKATNLSVGDIICVGDATNMEDVIEQKGKPDIFGKITFIKYDAKTECYRVELSAPELTELFSSLNIYSSDAILRDSIEFVSEEQLSKQATQILYQSDDFAKLVCAVQDTSVTYLSSRGYVTPLASIQDFFNCIKVSQTESQFPKINNDGTISGKIVINGEIPIPITLTEAPDSEQLGEINFYFKATISLDSLQIVLSLDDQTVNTGDGEKIVKAQIGSKQQISIGFTMGVKMQMDWSLSSKPYVLNNKTGTYHYATCKHIASIKDSAYIEKLSSENFFEKIADKSIAIEKECKTCQPVSCMLSDSLVISNETKTIHTPSCQHVQKLKSTKVEISDLPLGNLLASSAGYKECLDCTPSNRTTNSFSEQVLQAMKSKDLGDNLDTFKAIAKEAGESPAASTLQIGSIHFTITGLDVIELQLGVYFDFNLEATLEYNLNLQINSEFGIYLNKNGFIPYFDSKEEQKQNTLTLTGKTRMDVGLEAGINIHLIGLEKYCFAELSARTGLYAKLNGALQYDFIYDHCNYASAYFEAGLHTNLVGNARLIFIKTGEQSFLPENLRDHPFLCYGYDKIYYNFDKMPTEITLDTIYYNLENANILNVKYYDIVSMKEGTDQLNILGIKDKYKVDFALKNSTNCTISNGYILVNTPQQAFSDELLITVTGTDKWGKYRTGNTQYNLDTYTIPIHYDPANVDPSLISIPSGGLEYNGHYYKVYTNNAATWEDAKIFCENRGGYLAVISSQEENDALYAYLQSVGVDTAYFGLSKNDQGIWEWVNSEDCNYTNWHSGEPNNEGNDEFYGEFYYKFPDGTWNDGNFSHGTVKDSVSFICEWETYQFAPEHTEDMTAAGRLNALVGYYQGWYTASQGITGGSIGVHRTNALLQDEAALRMYADLATKSAKDAGNITTSYTIEDIRNIIEKHTEEYIAIYIYGPLRENPSVESGLYTMAVTYNENSKTYEFTSREWIYHDTYVFVDVKNASLRGKALLGNIYGPTGYFGNYAKAGEISLVRYTPSFETETTN